MAKKKTPYKFFCEHCKAAPKNGQWKRNYKWKTQNGFDSHHCWKDISEQREKEKVNRETGARLFQEWVALRLTKHQIGDEIPVIAYIVTAPTHEQRFNRMVKVRYEEKRRYYADTKTLIGFAPPPYIYIQEIEQAIENRAMFAHGYQFSGGGVVVRRCATLEEAQEQARALQQGHEEHLRDSQLNR